jgi:hypothetical protein
MRLYPSAAGYHSSALYTASATASSSGAPTSYYAALKYGLHVRLEYTPAAVPGEELTRS